MFLLYFPFTFEVSSPPLIFILWPKLPGWVERWVCYDGRVLSHSSSSLPELNQGCESLVVWVPSRIEGSIIFSTLALQVRIDNCVWIPIWMLLSVIIWSELEREKEWLISMFRLQILCNTISYLFNVCQILLRILHELIHLVPTVAIWSIKDWDEKTEAQRHQVTCLQSQG